MANIPKIDRADANCTKEIKVRLTEADYLKLEHLSKAFNTYVGSLVRKSVTRYLREMES